MNQCQGIAGKTNNCCRQHGKIWWVLCSKVINNKGCITSCGLFNHQESIKRKQVNDKKSARLITSNQSSLEMKLPNFIGSQCLIELAEVYNPTGHIKNVIVEYNTLQNYSVGCKLNSLNHDKIKENPFQIKFKGNETIPAKSLVIHKSNLVSLTQPQALPGELRNHYGSKLAKDITANSMKTLPQISLGVDNKKIQPLLLRLPKDIKKQFPNLNLYQSQITGKLLILGKNPTQ